METVTFTYLGTKCEYNFKTGNLHVISKHSFNSPNQFLRKFISKKHNIKKEDIKTITFKYNNTQLPSHLYYYFTSYKNLEHIELEKLDFKNVKTINKFIYNCPKLKEITIAHKNAENLISIKDFIVDIENTKSITIKNINTPSLKEVSFLLWNIRNSIENIIIENITAPNIDIVTQLISNSSINHLHLTKIGNVNTPTIKALIKNCTKLKTLKMKPLTNTKEIGTFIELSPLLETKIISKINQVEKLEQNFLKLTPKKEALDLDKFKDISELSSHLKECIYDKYIYPSIKIGRHRLKFSEYSIILENNIPIQDKTEKEIIKEIITQSKSETKENIEHFLEILESKKIFKNEEYKNELTERLKIIKNLK